MQTWSGPNTEGTNLLTRKITLYALLFFSLAGLISGFAFGGFLFPGGNNTGNNTGPIVKSAQPSPTSAAATPTTEAIVQLGIPTFITYPKNPESAAGATVYSVGIQVVDRDNKPVHASDITCKAWLVQQIPDDQKLSLDTNTLKAVNAISNPITGTVNNMPAPEVVGALTFTTPQTGFCQSNGQMTWKYTIAPNTAPGAYDIVTLADWKGVRFNWSWVNITIQ